MKGQAKELGGFSFASIDRNCLHYRKMNLHFLCSFNIHDFPKFIEDFSEFVWSWDVDCQQISLGLYKSETYEEFFEKTKGNLKRAGFSY
jgi:hypothetical protein